MEFEKGAEELMNANPASGSKEAPLEPMADKPETR